MKRIPLLLGLMLSALAACTPSAPETSREMVLWYDAPAGQVWLDGLFIGNGYMGGNVFGRTDHERIALNESTFWSGRPHDYNDPEAHAYYDQIKELVYAKKYKEAERLVDAHFYGKPANQQTYVPVGDLLLDFQGSGKPVTDYYREQLVAHHFDIIPGTHPIVPIMLYEETVAAEFAARMREKGVYVVAFSYPVVPKGKARIRTQVCANHTKKDIDFVIGCLKEVREEMGS